MAAFRRFWVPGEGCTQKRHDNYDNLNIYDMVDTVTWRREVDSHIDDCRWFRSPEKKRKKTRKRKVTKEKMKQGMMKSMNEEKEDIEEEYDEDEEEK